MAKLILENDDLAMIREQMSWYEVPEEKFDQVVNRVHRTMTSVDYWQEEVRSFAEDLEEA